MKSIDFGKTANDYVQHRQSFPLEFFEKLAQKSLIKPAMKILDIGTGTGTVARGLAQAGCNVMGIDIAKPLLKEAKKLDQAAGVKIKYRLGSAEHTGCHSASFDIVIAGQCWHWFKAKQTLLEIIRILKPQGKIIIAHFDWLPIKKSVPALTEKLMIKHNPNWKFGGGNGFYPQWTTQLAETGFKEIETYTFDKKIEYTHEGWRGRIRASAAIGAALSPEQINKFDKAHAQSLKKYFPAENLDILHRVFTLFAARP